MKESLQYIAKLTTTGFISFLKINILGLVSCFAALMLQWRFLKQSMLAEGITNTGLSNVFTQRPIGALFLLFTAFGLPFIIFLLGNKYVVSKLSHQLVNDKSGTYLAPLLDKVLAKVNGPQGGIIKKGADFAVNKMKIVQTLQAETEHKWLKRIVAFGLERVHLDDVDFQQDHLSVNKVVRNKTIEALQDMIAPSKIWLWAALAAPWLLVLFAWFL
jgi:uncharacterized membrane protein required for colicin V production